MTYPGAIYRDSGEETKNQSLAADRLDFLFATRILPCPYLPDKAERKVVVELADGSAGRDYERLIRAGYRRSGGLALSRSLRRVEGANRDLDVRILAPEARAEHFDLFRRYQDGRHGGGEMADMDFMEYRALVEESHVATRLAEFRGPGGGLMAVCLFDELDDSLSAVYTFFEPSITKRSLGSYMILWLAAECRESGKSHLYLGYWIEKCAKMAYKARFRPLEVLDQGAWRPME